MVSKENKLTFCKLVEEARRNAREKNKKKMSLWIKLMKKNLILLLNDLRSLLLLDEKDKSLTCQQQEEKGKRFRDRYNDGGLKFLFIFSYFFGETVTETRRKALPSFVESSSYFSENGWNVRSIFC